MTRPEVSLMVRRAKWAHGCTGGVGDRMRLRHNDLVTYLDQMTNDQFPMTNDGSGAEGPLARRGSRPRERGAALSQGGQLALRKTHSA